MCLTLGGSASQAASGRTWRRGFGAPASRVSPTTNTVADLGMLREPLRHLLLELTHCENSGSGSGRPSRTYEQLLREIA